MDNLAKHQNVKKKTIIFKIEVIQIFLGNKYVSFAFCYKATNLTL